MLARLFGQKPPSKEELRLYIEQLVDSAGIPPSATFALLKKDILRLCKAIKCDQCIISFALLICPTGPSYWPSPPSSS